MTTIQKQNIPNGAIRPLQVLNILGFMLMIVFNFLANWLPLNGITTGALSDKYSNLFVPSGPTFSIWGIIYLLLLFFTIYQGKTLFISKDSHVNYMVSKLGIWYVATSILNTLWIIAWHFELLPISVAIMWSLLFCLILANFRIANSNINHSLGIKFLTKASFGIYLGWISVATIANMSAWFTSIQWRLAFDEETWTVIMIVIGAILTTYTARRLSNGFLTLAVVWAFVGIIAKRIHEEPLYYSIIIMAGICIVILVVYSSVLLARDYRKEKMGVKEPWNVHE